MIKIDSEEINDKWCQELRVPIINVSKGGPGSGIKGHKTERTKTSFDVCYKGGTEQQKKVIKEGIKQFEKRFPKITYEILNSQKLGIKTKKEKINVLFVNKQKTKDVIMLTHYPNIYVNKNASFGPEIIQHELIHIYQLTQIGYNEKIKFGKELYPKEPAYFINEYHAYAFDGLIYKLNKNQSKSKFNKDELWVAKEHNINVNSFIKGGPGSGIKGHRTEKEPPKKLPKHLALPADVEEILYKYEYMEKLTEYQLEKFRKQILGKVKEAKKKYTKIAGYFPGDTEFERLHRKIVVDLEKIENKLESAFTVGEKKIAIDAVFYVSHVHGRYAIFEGTGENIKRALDYIRDQRIHKFSKGGPGSGIRGHTTYKEEKGYLKAIKEIELFEAQVKNEPYEYGRLIDKDGKVLFSTEGRNPDSIYITDQQMNILQSRKGFVFSHNHPFSTSFSITDIYTSIKYNTKEVRAVSKRYLYVMKFKRYISLKDFESRGEVYQEIYRKLFYQYQKKIFEGKITKEEASRQMSHNAWENFVKMYPKDFEYSREPSKKGYGDIEKGGPGSGIKGHRTEKKYKNILSFENKIRNEKKENGLLCDKDGNVLFTAEGTEETILFSASDRKFFFNKAAGGIFTHNHPLGNSFSRTDIFSSMKAKLQEVRVVGKEYTHSIKFKKEVPANIRDKFSQRYDQVFSETYVLFRHKIFNGMSNRKAQQSCFHGMIQKISKEYSEYFTYKRTTSFSKGGIGSGIKGHTTAKKEKSKLYKTVEEFETKYRKRKMENGLLLDSEGNVLLAKKGRKDRISYTREEELKFFLSKKGHLFTHNHPNDATFSESDFTTHWVAGLKESRAVGPTNTFILRTIKEIPKEVYHNMVASFQTHHNHFFQKYTQKVQEEKMDAYDATIAYADEAMKVFVKEFPEYLHYQKITIVEKGGIGSGIKGHRTHKEKNEKIRKTYKMIKNFENKIRRKSIENCLIVDGEGKVLVSKQGTESTIYLTENERYTCREKAKKGKVIFSHNHPSSSSFSLDDILTANNFHFSESRIASKEHDYVMKISKPLDRDEVMASFRAQNAYYYEIFNPLVATEKLDRHKAWMTHTHLIWKHVAEEIDGLEYKRTR